MRTAATALLSHLDDESRARGQLDFADDAARRWIEYRPRPRPGVCLAELDPPGHKAAQRLLATALSTHAYAQAVTVMAVEEVLDRAEGGHRGRFMNDYRVTVFGEPSDDARWGWRYEGHHLSVSMTVAGGEVTPAPLFVGLNPATVSYQGHPVLRPFALEEELGRALVTGLSRTERDRAVVADEAPRDILSATRPRVEARTEPMGVPAGALDTAGRALLDRLLGVYLDRLVPSLAAQEAARLRDAQLHFAWAGATEPGHGHYYRIQGPDLLIEYDNTQNGANHPHTVLRRPLTDFGDDVLAAHYGESGALSS
jgi:uncharacterized protein DUF3500